MDGFNAVFFVSSDHENVACSSSESGHFCFEGFEVKRIEDFYEVGDEVGAVLAAQRGLEDEPSVAATGGVVASGGGEHRDLVGLRRNGFKLGNLRGLLLQLLHPLDNLRQKRSLVCLKPKIKQQPCEINTTIYCNIMYGIINITYLCKSKLTFPNSIMRECLYQSSWGFLYGNMK